MSSKTPKAVDVCMIVAGGSWELANVIASEGDWAVVDVGSYVSLTHLPTGSMIAHRLKAVGTEHLALQDAMRDLVSVPKFDAQTARQHFAAIACVLKKHKVVPSTSSRGQSWTS